MAAPVSVMGAGHEAQDISPKTPVPTDSSQDYFPKEFDGSTTSHRTDESIDSSEFESSDASVFSDTTPAPQTTKANPVEQNQTSLRRHSSVSSVTIQLPRNPNLPQGCEKRINRGRLRNASPKPERFQKRVAFDNIPLGEATKNNTPSLTLNDKHKGYRAGRRSRTFMVGVDEHAYSDYALQWLLDELVDDGDEVVCVRVMEKDIRPNDKSYLEEARSIMDSIRAKNTSGKALSFILEYAVGKLHGTFQKLIHMHQPAMLVVGTRGRSLGGLQGLVNTRNSFSKYCLQYSPVPVVVVRPTEKRIKKKEKRAADASRQTYAGMLSATDGKHEADSEAGRQYDFEVKISPDEEAHQVAKVLGLPAAFDPTIKPLAQPANSRLAPSPSAPTLQTTTEAPQTEPSVSSGPLSAGSDSSDSEDEDGEGDFEVATGEQALEQAKKRELHKMEVGEAMALRDKQRGSDSDSDDDGNSKNASWKLRSPIPILKRKSCRFQVGSHLVEGPWIDTTVSMSQHSDSRGPEVDYRGDWDEPSPPKALDHRPFSAVQNLFLPRARELLAPISSRNSAQEAPQDGSSLEGPWMEENEGSPTHGLLPDQRIVSQDGPDDGANDKADADMDEAPVWSTESDSDSGICCLPWTLCNPLSCLSRIRPKDVKKPSRIRGLIRGGRLPSAPRQNDTQLIQLRRQDTDKQRPGKSSAEERTPAGNVSAEPPAPSPATEGVADMEVVYGQTVDIMEALSPTDNRRQKHSNSQPQLDAKKYIPQDHDESMLFFDWLFHWFDYCPHCEAGIEWGLRRTCYPDWHPSHPSEKEWRAACVHCKQILRATLKQLEQPTLSVLPGDKTARAQRPRSALSTVTEEDSINGEGPRDMITGEGGTFIEETFDNGEGPSNRTLGVTITVTEEDWSSEEEGASDWVKGDSSFQDCSVSGDVDPDPKSKGKGKLIASSEHEESPKSQDLPPKPDLRVRFAEPASRPHSLESIIRNIEAPRSLDAVVMQGDGGSSTRGSDADAQEREVDEMELPRLRRVSSRRP